MPDARAVRVWIENGSASLTGMHKYSGFQIARPKTRAVVVGDGFIGLEMTENLVHREDVTVVEMADQIPLPMDREMAQTESEAGVAMHRVWRRRQYRKIRAVAPSLQAADCDLI